MPNFAMVQAMFQPLQNVGRTPCFLS